MGAYLMPVRRDPLDALFSDLVRERASWSCEACSAYFGPGERQGLHCSHHISRRFNATRWSPLNAAAHCARCHRHFTDNPVEHARWIIAAIGELNYENLKMAAQRITPLKKHDREDIRKTLKAQLADMRRQRERGHAGRIEFSGWMP